MKALIVSREAELDIADSFVWYYERNPAVADTFLLSVREVVGLIAEQPNRFPQLERAVQMRARTAAGMRAPHRGT